MLRVNAYYKLGDVSEKIGSGSTPKGGQSVYIEDGVSLIRSQNVYNMEFSYNGLAHIDDNAAKILKNVVLKEEDILLNITGDSVARCCIVPKDVLPARVNQHVSIVRVDTSLINPKFLMYYLVSPFMQKYLIMLAQGKGASRSALTKEMISKLDIPKIDLNCQAIITNSLEKYDLLIENNKKRIKILEQMIEEIYKEIFSRKDFGILHLSESNCSRNGKYKKIREIISFERGISYSSEEIDCDDGVNLINLKNINSFGGFRRDGYKKYSGKYKDSQIVNKGDLVMGITDMTQDRRTVGHVALVPVSKGVSVISADLVKVNSDINNVYLYCLFKYGDISKYISQYANGSNVLHLRPTMIQNVAIPIVEETVISQFVDLVGPLFEQMEVLNIKNENLTKQRDLLLPRLMSGKLEVKESE